MKTRTFSPLTGWHLGVLVAAGLLMASQAYFYWLRMILPWGLVLSFAVVLATFAVAAGVRALTIPAFLGVTALTLVEVSKLSRLDLTLGQPVLPLSGDIGGAIDTLIGPGFAAVVLGRLAFAQLLKQPLNPGPMPARFGGQNGRSDAETGMILVLGLSVLTSFCWMVITGIQFLGSTLEADYVRAYWWGVGANGVLLIALAALLGRARFSGQIVSALALLSLGWAAFQLVTRIDEPNEAFVRVLIVGTIGQFIWNLMVLWLGVREIGRGHRTTPTIHASPTV